MISAYNGKSILWLSLSTALLIIFTSSVGLWVIDFYGKESPNWQAQAIGQDSVNLFLLVPCLLITGFLASKNSNAKVLCGGIVLYFIYTFIIFAMTPGVIKSFELKNKIFIV